MENTIKEIMSVNTDNIVEKQFKALKEHTIKILQDVIDHINTNKFNHIIYNMISHSGSGDGYGQENDYIDFGYDGENSLDIKEVCELLDNLKTILKNNFKKQ